MAKTKVKLLYSGFDELRKCQEMESALLELAQGIASRAGEGYSADVIRGRKKLIASAYTDSTAARVECVRTGGDPLLEAMQRD